MLYIDSNKKRVKTWEERNGLQLPVGTSVPNSNKSISNNNKNVNTQKGKVNSNNNLSGNINTTAYNNAAQKGNETTTYTYDSKGNVLSYITGNEKNNTYYTYDSNKRVIREQTGNDYTYYTYDSKGNNLVLTTLKKDYKGEAPELYDSSLTCFDTVCYTYDENGIRTSKTVNGKTTYYNTKDGVILSQTDGTNTMYFQYNIKNMPLGFIWNGTQYFY